VETIKAPQPSVHFLFINIHARNKNYIYPQWVRKINFNGRIGVFRQWKLNDGVSFVANLIQLKSRVLYIQFQRRAVRHLARIHISHSLTILLPNNISNYFMYKYPYHVIWDSTFGRFSLHYKEIFTIFFLFSRKEKLCRPSKAPLWERESKGFWFTSELFDIHRLISSPITMILSSVALYLRLTGCP